MTFKQLFCGFLALVMPAVIFAQPPPVANSSGLKNTVILIIRHAEQPDAGFGLSAAGEARARDYVSYFENFTVEGRPLRLDYVFAAKDSPNSHRPRLTIEPTAKALGLKVDSRFKNKQFLELADEVESRPHGENVLICWHHGTISQLLRALGADPNRLLPDGKWPNDVFGWLIELRYDESGRLVEGKRINESLSSDDSGDYTLVAA
jgi:broad specificity phosphatase PhoE